MDTETNFWDDILQGNGRQAKAPSPALLSTSTVTLDKSLGPRGPHFLICSREPLGHMICIVPSCSKTLSLRQLLQSQDRIRCCIEWQTKRPGREDDSEGLKESGSLITEDSEGGS